MINDAIYQLINKEDLSLETAKAAMDEIMQGKATDVQIASFLTSMRMKGESIDEITASAMIMRKHCQTIPCNCDVLDIVGTGGDEAYTFNISTIASLVIAAAGVPVAKHGNRSISSKCGSADLLEALGVKIDLQAEASAILLKKIGICFLFAPTYHTSMQYAAPVRRELGIRTIFNILGPLANPAGATLQLLGVYDRHLVEPMAQVLSNLGVKHAMVVHGHDGLDEISLSAPTTICEVQGKSLHTFTFDPQDYGFAYCQAEDLIGGDAEENAIIAHRILSGEEGSKRDIVLLNAAVCLYMADQQLTIKAAIDLAAQMIDSGRAQEKLSQFITYSHQVTSC